MAVWKARYALGAGQPSHQSGTVERFSNLMLPKSELNKSLLMGDHTDAPIDTT